MEETGEIPAMGPLSEEALVLVKVLEGAQLLLISSASSVPPSLQRRGKVHPFHLQPQIPPLLQFVPLPPLHALSASLLLSSLFSSSPPFLVFLLFIFVFSVLLSVVESERLVQADFPVKIFSLNARSFFFF